MIEINEVTKIYKLNKKQMLRMRTDKSQKCACENITLKMLQGEIYGVLGPNGAGKTTLLRCLATLLKPTDGNIMVCGYDVQKQPQEVRKRIGFLTNEVKLDRQFSPRYLCSFIGKLHGIKKEVIDLRMKELFNYFGITEFQDRKIGELSTGMEQKAAIAMSLIHDPEVIIFDEPTNGLDIVTARSVTNYLMLLKERGKTVVISTHSMHEAEKLCTRIGVIIQGKKASEGTVSEILQQTETTDLEDAFFKLYQEYNMENDI